MTESPAPEKESKLALLRAENLIATLREPFLMLDGNLRIISANPSFYKTFKVKERETVGTLLPELGNKQWNIPKLLHLLEKILSEKAVVEDFEVAHIFPKIGQRTMLLNARRIPPPPGEPQTILLAIEDITERKTAERKAQKAREYAESIVATLREPFLVVDKNLRIVSANQSFYKTFKVKEKETIGQLLPDLGNRQWDIPKLLHLLKEILSKKTVVENYEITHDFEQIGPRIMHVNARKLHLPIKIARPAATEEEEEEELVLLAVEDITEQKKTRTRAIERTVLREKLEQQKEVDRLKTEFVSVASHQLRTPLSAIKWFLEMVLGGDAGEINAEQRNYLQQVFDSNERMIRLINDLLNVSRLEMGRIVVEPVPTDLVKLVKEVLKDFEPVVAARKQALTLEGVGKIPPASFDPNLIHQVVQNLVSNATGYTPKGGKIMVKIWIEGEDIVLAVKDSGCGIPKGEQDRVFTKFFRASNITQEQAEGTGMGLYIAKGIVEVSGGKMWFESEENEGSTFYFSLPCI